MFRRNRNRDSCEKNATGTENTEIRRIPAGIGNLVDGHHDASVIPRTLLMEEVQGFPKSH
jgi:hypothetical protein